jgi:hypothetical protein
LQISEDRSFCESIHKFQKHLFRKYQSQHEKQNILEVSIEKKIESETVTIKQKHFKDELQRRQLSIAEYQEKMRNVLV